MAQIHAMPGRYPKGEAARRSRSILTIVVASSLLCGAALGFAVAFSRHLLVLPLLGLVGVGAVFVLRLIDPVIDKLGRERIRYFRGAQGESLVGWLLNELDDDWHVFHGVQLKEASDIDHIVIGPGGVFCISTKSIRGLFSLREDGVILYNNEPTDMARDVLRQAMEVRSRLTGLLGRDAPFVNAVLAVPLAYVQLNGPLGNVWVLHQEDLTKIVAGGQKKLAKPIIGKCVRALEMISENGKEIFPTVASISHDAS